MLVLHAHDNSRGVAQPGRAPGSGPGGRRFKSSLPDQYSQTLEVYFWFSVYIDGVDFVDGRVFSRLRAEHLSQEEAHANHPTFLLRAPIELDDEAVM